MPEVSEPTASTGAADGRAPAPWLRALLGSLSPAGRRARLSILIFHRVRAEPDPLFPNEMHAAVFAERMRCVRQWCNVLSLVDAVAALSRGTLPARALAISFDDGYADNATVALPILRQLRLPATFFVATDFLDGGRMWNDTVIETVRAAPGGELDLSRHGFGRHPIGSLTQRRAAIGAILAQLKYLPQPERQSRVDAIAAETGAAPPRDLMMTHDQLRGIAAAGMGIGAHTVSHPILARLDDATARREIADGRDALVAIVRAPVRLFAYPNGRPNVDYATRHVEMARELGFTAAVSTAAGAARAGDSLFELPRFTPWDRSPVQWGMRLARNLLTRIERAAA